MSSVTPKTYRPRVHVVLDPRNVPPIPRTRTIDLLIPTRGHTAAGPTGAVALGVRSRQSGGCPGRSGGGHKRNRVRGLSGPARRAVGAVRPRLRDRWLSAGPPSGISRVVVPRGRRCRGAPPTLNPHTKKGGGLVRYGRREPLSLSVPLGMDVLEAFRLDISAGSGSSHHASWLARRPR